MFELYCTIGAYVDWTVQNPRIKRHLIEDQCYIPAYLEYIGLADNEIDLVRLFNEHVEDYISSGNHAPFIIVRSVESGKFISGNNVDSKVTELLNAR